jgi:hypothetical protein
VQLYEYIRIWKIKEEGRKRERKEDKRRGKKRKRRGKEGNRGVLVKCISKKYAKQR